MPTKNWQRIQEVSISMDLEEDLKTCTLMPYETDDMTVALTGCLHLQGKTELIGDNKEDYIVT
jgi:hypothetical protein